MILDLGCGNNPKGDVNLDLYVRGTSHRGWNDEALDTKRIPNFVRADVRIDLPFRNDVFDEVHAYQLIEHLPNPLRLLMEMKRVSRNKVIIECPHRLTCFQDAWSKKYHISVMTVKYLAELFKAVNLRVLFCSTITWKSYPSEVVTLLKLPYVLRCVGEKK